MPSLGNEPRVYPEVLRLMAQASVNHYHNPEGKPPLREFAEQAWSFSKREYLGALFEGEALSSDNRSKICERLEYFTGIDAGWFCRHDMKVSDETFRKAVLKNSGVDVGAYDGRYTMRHSDLPACPIR
jgi:hypothetical protein